MVRSAVPTACIDYQAGGAAEVEFVALNHAAQPACQAWTKTTARQGSLWTQQEPQNVQYIRLSQVCSLSTAAGAVTASVVDEGTQTSGQAACSSLIASGWSSAAPGAGPPIRNASPTGTTRFLIPKSTDPRHYPHVEPSEFDFSGDGGNVVTGIVWSRWSGTEAVGYGSSVIQSCNPSCAQGAQVQVSTTIMLLDPAHGHFTQLLEERGGLTSVAAYGVLPNSYTAAVGIWPAQAG
jgi:hypothetical protein